MDIIDLIKLGGYPLSVAAFFYGLHVGKIKVKNEILTKKLNEVEDDKLYKEALNSVPIDDKRTMFDKLPQNNEW